MSASPSRCVVVGDVSLSARCASLLRDRGRHVTLVTDRADVAAAITPAAVDADGAEIEVVPFASLASSVAAGDVELLVSAGNLRILPDAVVSSVRRAINFHDGPLPELGGRNVTSWAIAQERSEHGITWHELTSVVDGGRILVQERFALTGDETAFELNARCFEAALRTFPAVLDAVLDGALDANASRGASPDEMRRSTDRLGPQALLTTTQSARRFSAAVRALDLGSQTVNPLGRARWHTGADVLVVAAATVLPAVPDAMPGTVVRMGGDDLDVALHDGVLRLSRLEHGDGSIATTAGLGLRVGALLPIGTDEELDALLATERAVAMHEPAWCAALEHVSLDPVRPLVAGPARVGGGAWFAIGRIDGVQGIDDAAALAALWGRHHRGIDAPLVSLPTTNPPAATPAGLLVDAFLDGGADDAARGGTAAPLRLERDRLAAAAAQARARGGFLADLVGRVPVARGHDLPAATVASVRTAFDADAPGLLQLVVDVATGEVRAHASGLDGGGIAAAVVAGQLHAIASCDGTSARPERSDAEREVLARLNDTAAPAPAATSVWDDVRAALAARGDAIVLRSETTALTGQQVIERVGARAAALRRAGIGTGDRVGLALDRSHELVITLLAVLRVGAAYVPIDPEYPEARRRFVTNDADLAVLLVEPHANDADGAAGDGVRRLTLAGLDGAGLDGASFDADADDATPADRRADPAYLIYTSGSTGTPKAVVVEHRNVLNLFVGLDRLLTPTEGAVWLAATSLSFDISVLELLWTLHARLCVVVAPLLRLGPDARAALTSTAPERADDAALPSLSLYFFAAAGGAPGDDQPGLYDFVLESVAVADEAGLEAVWFPERHFHEFGGPYANPSVLAAAVATRTSHVQLRAGSVVAALHHPARITEEWSMVDRLSKGRVGVSFASGWMPRDGVLQPAGRSIGRDGMVATVDEVRRLWRGEVLRFASGDGTEFAVTTMPRPVQPELPVWLTSAGSPETFELTGRLGFNMLTHLLGQDVERLAANIERYRNAWTEAGHPGRGRVTLMLHAYLDDDGDEVVRQVHQPMKDYLRSAVGLVGSLATAFPTFATVGHDYDRLFAELDADEVEVLLDAAASRYEQTAGLFGTQAAALDMLRRVAAVGVDEVACLIDFGVEHDAALAGVGRIAELHHEVERLRRGIGDDAPERAVGFGGRFAELVTREDVTHFQCTPSQATLLVSDPADARALGQLEHLLVGGEALPVSLANELRARVPGRITNVYGPTETTVWSLAAEIGAAPIERVSIGTPLANQRIDVVDADLRPVPLGRPGELVISGDGVAWGYRGREELSAERFVERDGTRWYRTGDLVVVQPDGVVLFLGRADDQVKISGHRIELGDIEAALLATAGIREAAVVVEGSDASARLAAYVVADASGFDAEAVRASLSATLPPVMVPSVLRRLDRLPRTPNGKLDRRAVGAAMPSTPATPVPLAGLSGDVDAVVRDAWTEVLGEVAPPDAPFFSVGGNSLLAVRLFRLLEPLTDGRFQLTDVFRYPTMRAMAAHVATLRAASNPAADASTGPDGNDATAPAAATPSAEAIDRGARRRAARGR